MSAKLWTDVDAYVVDKLMPADAVMEASLRANAAGGLPAIDVSPAQGKLLHLLVRMSGARRVLEIGTLGGYSTIWMARALPANGELVTLEFEPVHAAVAKGNIETAGLSGKVDIRVGKAADLLPVLAAENQTPFDFIFIDADKPSNPIYLDWALKLSRPGTVIVCDNVIRDGAVIRANSGDANVDGARSAFDFFASHPQVTATAIQTVGAKGYDGFAIGILG
ncbi:O-methyltransferase [Devosia sp.]|uniref:O-methyltransferase n=1 Tax=Devosia sp. TaxID=1871048 RepID=UPI0032661CCA